MKLITTLSVCLLVSCAAFAQTTPVKKHKSDRADKTVIYGTLRDARNKPYKGMKAFVYKPDSTIVASGYTDADGHYETNAVAPGIYFVKLIYPTDNKVALIYNIEVKKSVELNYSSNSPVEDTMISYDVIMPKAKPAPKRR